MQYPQGPKIRLRDCTSDVILSEGQLITFAIGFDEHDIVRVTGDGPRLTMKATREQIALMDALQIGTDLLIEDGRLKVRVVERHSKTEVVAEVLVAGRVKARQGVNVPSVRIDCPALTAKDIEDAEFLLSLDPPIDYIAVSFVQSAADLQELIDVMDRLGLPANRRPKICPKIEKPLALANLSEILDLSGAMMVARGDLGVEMGLEYVPMAQKLMIRMAREKNVHPIINATQMMESMMKCPWPQKSEISDVANAVWDGADAVMLSGEAAMGGFPCETVKWMASTALHAQRKLGKVAPTFPLDQPAPDMSVVFGLEPKTNAKALEEERPAAKRTAVLATLGPATTKPGMLDKLVAAGIEIFRLNCTYRSAAWAIRRLVSSGRSR